MMKDYWRLIAAITVLQTLFNYTLLYHGLDLVPGALGAVVVGSQPLVTAVISSLLNKNDKLSRKKILTIIFGIAGVIFISAGRQALKLGSIIELLGVLMILMANIALATGNVLISLKSKGLNPFVLSSSSLFLGGVVLYLVSFPIEGRPPDSFPKEYWIVLLWLSFMAAVAFSIWFILIQRPGVKISELNLWKFIIPVSGAILSWIFVPDEDPEWLTISGMIIITLSLMMFYRSTKTTPAD